MKRDFSISSCAAICACSAFLIANGAIARPSSARCAVRRTSRSRFLLEPRIYSLSRSISSTLALGVEILRPDLDPGVRCSILVAHAAARFDRLRQLGQALGRRRALGAIEKFKVWVLIKIEQARRFSRSSPFCARTFQREPP